MNSGYYAAYTGLAARMEALDLLANNLANANTTGFRGQNEFYRDVTASLSDFPLTPLNRAINDFAVLGGTSLDLRQANLTPTGNNLDLAISGPGFFAVNTPRGVRYTRNGQFHVNTAGQIVTESNDIVLGPSGPIQLPPGQVEISSDGTVSVASAVAGQVRLVEFAPETQLTPEGNSYLLAPAGTEVAAKNSEVTQGMLEAANVDPVHATIRLMILQRHAEQLERTLSIFLNDFNRTAATDLARD